MELIYSTGKSIKQIAREIGCSSSSLGEWKRNYEQDNSASEISSQPVNLQQLHQHIKQLEKELKRVKEEREILKKAAGIPQTFFIPPKVRALFLLSPGHGTPASAGVL